MKNSESRARPVLSDKTSFKLSSSAMVWLFQDSNQRHFCKKSKYYCKSKESRNTLRLVFEIVPALGRRRSQPEDIWNSSLCKYFDSVGLPTPQADGKAIFYLVILKETTRNNFIRSDVGIMFNLMLLKKRKKGTSFQYCLGNKNDINV